MNPPLRRLARGVAGAVVFALLGTAAGCAQEDPAAGQGAPPIGALLPVGDLRTFSLPLDPYLIGPDQTRPISQATEALARSCMLRFGFDMPPSPVIPAPYTRHERRYGLIDAAAAAVDGYRPSKAIAAGGRKPERAPFSAAAQAVVTGNGPKVHNGLAVPDGGCMGEARRRLEEGIGKVSQPDLAEQLSRDSYARSQEDDRVVQAFGRWSECMSRAGFDYTDPHQAINDPGWQGDRPGEREIATALADARCKKEVDLVAIWATVETAYQQQAVQRHGEALREIAQALQTRLTNAARIVVELG
ncbi:hypothetical protein ACFQZ4_01345 [Catellatospora coxensis]|uniref:Lipoprotein n=1 Tax=Catellatospora coxensis TaxID=310354 RepID=A0A8J3KYZ2_9ACTN|nr:hypothetical protein [Catellatospora coxensis]GIG08788.1 hypothetical protein Cco03nite_54880 [Catellatospora coxensis]